MTTPRIAVFSFADIDNYGDILFSWVVRNELRKRRPGVVVDFFTPSDCELEGERYVGYTRERVDGRYDALMLAGGEVVHFFDERTWAPIYQRRGLDVLTGRPSDVVWDWASCDAAFKAWLSVGVRPFEAMWDAERVRRTLDRLDMIATRGILSKKILEGGDYAAADDRITITPDLGWLFPRLMNEIGSDSPRPAGFPSGKYAVFQFHNVTEAEGIEIAKVLVDFRRRTGLEVVLLPVIHLWNDRAPMQKIVDASGGVISMPDEKLSVRQIAHAAMGAEVVLCSSLHVAITAMAAGVPAAVFNKWPGTKFQDLFGLQMRADRFVRQVGGIEATLRGLLEERERRDHLRAYSTFMVAMLDRTFDYVASQL